MALPRTVWLWLALLILTAIALPRDEEKPLRRAPVREAGLSASAFEKYVEAESNTRDAFVIGALGARAGQREKMLDSAVRSYRSLTASTSSSNMPRRVLILENYRGRPLDEAILTRALPADLKAAGKTPEEITAEITLWRSLYGKKPFVASADVPDAERRIRQMQLRFLQTRALHDLYAAAGQKERAAALQTALDQEATRHFSRKAVLVGGMILAFLAGLPLLIVFIVSAIRGQWATVGRVTTQPQRLGWGELLDAFVFYLTVVRVTGYAAAPLLARYLPSPTAPEILATHVIVYIGTGIFALAYLWGRIRMRGATLGDIGLRTGGNRLFADIGYGVAGYCATLPFFFALAFIARMIFQHSPNTSPNPILPLITADRDWTYRLTIFVLAAIAAPLFEELFFRGALYSGLRTRLGWVYSALLSAAFFAIVHPVQDWLPIFGLGVSFAVMREMRQSLVPSMTAHFVQNSLAFISLSTLFQ